ncbi:hypothetical protein [Flavihumibacter sp. CACIAM 22H1]|uniref:hypothetical protein n=1 Tax=Flavihumibacter sp. CACIAM 22H1 TaxID=1812911 RepID=UPI000A67FE13|nr:hypothetical protein [Flavihumibacter sp. CACIAM 22H1]
MIRYGVLLCCIVAICWSCGGANRLSRYYTEEDKAVFELVDQVKKTPADKALVRQLFDAYDMAFQKREKMDQYPGLGNHLGDHYMGIAREWEIVQKMYQAIRQLPLADKQQPVILDPTSRLNQVKQEAAEQYYQSGKALLGYNTRQQAVQALDYLEKANKAWPGYKDLNQLLQVAAERAVTRVLVNPVNYNRYNWSYWGFQNDWLQQQMVRDLNARAFRNVRFFTEWELRSQQLVPDKIVDLDFVELFVDRVHTERKRYDRSKSIKTGETKSNPPQPIYTTVRATVFVDRQYMTSYATLECRIYDRENNQNILFDRFPDRFNWVQERARFTGDRRALEPSDIALLNNRWDDRPPTREQIAEQLIRSTYQQLLSRINSGVSF